MNDISINKMSLWTVEDKRKLLVALHQYGAGNLEVIHQQLPDKTIEDIKGICEKHTKLALKKWHNRKDDKNGPSIKNWLQILKRIKTTQKESIHDIVPRLLKYIALFEKRADCSQINLRDCYFVLSDISNGQASMKMDQSSDYFFYECLTKLAKSIKQGEFRSFKCHLRSLQSLTDLNLHRQEGINTRKECSSILNPLGIPENLLKTSSLEID
ncbi:hypothetical protein JTB14_016052 [Gonioctena quinquepunctata]|nr:hypothetical protein JTB14_016052 [Gonioctena quinquepunctata]